MLNCQNKYKAPWLWQTVVNGFSLPLLLHCSLLLVYLRGYIRTNPCCPPLARQRGRRRLFRVLGRSEKRRELRQVHQRSIAGRSNKLMVVMMMIIILRG